MKMGEPGLSVKELVGALELTLTNPCSVVEEENKTQHNLHVTSNDELPQISPKMARYRNQLQSELDQLFKMKQEMEHKNTQNKQEESEEAAGSSDEFLEKDDEYKDDSNNMQRSHKNYTSNARILLHSSSTMARGKALKRQRRFPAQTTFIKNVGIVSRCKTVVKDEDQKVDKERKNEIKLGKVLQEIVSSENVYVRRLAVLDDAFRKGLSKLNMQEYLIQWDLWNNLFSNIGSIHQFHKDDLLPRLEACLVSHFKPDFPKLYAGKVFADLSPYFKMYSEYAQNYKKCIEVLNSLALHSPKLQEFLDHFETLDICEGLKLSYFYIEPIQRLPRYELLLREYTACLSDDSEDLVNSHIALKLIKQANIHSNDSIKNEENFFKIREIEDGLRDSVDLLSIPRKFIKEGNLDVVLPVCGRVEEKRLFLFNDLLLICQYYPHPFRPPYCVTDKLDITQFQVKVVHDRLFLFGSQAILELMPKSPEEKMAWEAAFNSVMKGKQSNGLSLTMPPSPAIQQNQLKTLRSNSNIRMRPLGTSAPVMMKEQNVISCMECSEEFGFLNRKRSCWACGRVVCKQCSEHKEPLVYLSFEIKRVCNKCHEILQNNPNIPKMF